MSGKIERRVERSSSGQHSAVSCVEVGWRIHVYQHIWDNWRMGVAEQTNWQHENDFRHGDLCGCA